MSASTVIPAFLLLTFIYILSIFLRSNYKSKNDRRSAPGPLALPVIGNLYLLGTHPHRKLQSLANKYGPIMSLWLGQVPAIVVSSPEAAELFFKTHDPAFASRPTNEATDHLFFGSKGLSFSEYGPYWRNMKKLCGLHLFSASKFELFGPLRKETVRSMVKSLETAAAMGEVVNLNDKVNGLLEDKVCKMIFGRSKDDQFDLKGLISQAFNLGGAFNLADFVPCLASFDLQGLTRRLKETAKALDQMLEKIIKEHEHEHDSNKDGRPEDFIDMLLSLMANQDKDGEQENRIGRDNIKAIAVEIIFGAYETVSLTIDWTFSELLRNPKVMKNLRDEIQKVVGDRMVEETDLVNLNYLNMVIMESLRLYPAGPFVPRESVEDIVVEGYFISKKSRILINAWAIGRDPRIWSDNANEFYPERFLNNSVDFQGNQFLLVAFGGGRRKCPGLQMAVTMAKLAVAQLVHCFDWNLPNGMSPCDINMSETFGWTIPRSKPLLAVPTLRSHYKVHDE